MANLTNPVASQNVVDRFADFVVASANTGIVWGTNALPTSGADIVVPLSQFGGTTSGKTIGVNGSSIEAAPITASAIYTALLAETNNYTNIRQLRAILNVTGTGGNTGTRPVAGIIYDQTAKAYLATAYRQVIPSVDNAGVSTGNLIRATALETLFNNLRTAYTSAQNTVAVYQTNVCHASCHSSCHASRGRR